MLILTDFDCCSAEGNHRKIKYEPGKNQVTSNSALKYFFGNDTNSDALAAKTENEKRFVWDDVNRKMVANNDGAYMVCYQTSEEGYQPRSFEDDFMALNRDFVLGHVFTARAIKSSLDEVFDTVNKAFEAADKVDSKAAFAFEILLNSMEEILPNGGKDPFGGWLIPSYIREGLVWLRK